MVGLVFSGIIWASRGQGDRCLHGIRDGRPVFNNPAEEVAAGGRNGKKILLDNWF
jgi:hypothetical protein